MIESLKARWAIIATVLVVAILWVTPNFVKFSEDQWWPNKKTIVYGLDIQGGIHLVMGVNVGEVVKEKTARMANSLITEFKDQGLQVKSVEVNPQNQMQLSVVLNDAADLSKLEKFIEDYYPATLQQIDAEGVNVTLAYYQTKISQYKKQVVDQAIEVIRSRIDSFGVAEPSITAQGEDRILVQLPGIENAAGAKELINRTARLDFRIVSPEKTPAEVAAMVAKAEETGKFTLGIVKKDQAPPTDGIERLNYQKYLKRLNESLKPELPTETMIVFERAENATTIEAGKVPYLINTTVALSGDLLEDATVSYGERGEPEVVFKLSGEGRRRFAELTEKSVKDAQAKGQPFGYIAIVLDGQIKSAPSVKEKINSPSARITLGQRDYQASQKEANFIATSLRAGALPAALEQLEERTVGPTLGADSIARGKNAGLIGGLLVLIFMLVYYRFLGLVANFSLAFNILLILAALTSLGATLTLPGVAGIVLTIGMAVDANVIIFERIKEEIRKGAGLKAAVKDGFDHAFSAIFDANITTAAVCVVLMYFGTGPVRGFAVTLICGILTSMFTAIFVSRAIIEYCVVKFKMQKMAGA